MNKSLLTKCLFIATAAVMILCAGVGLAADKKVEWSFVSMIMNTHPVIANAVVPMFDRVKKETNGKFEVTVYNPETLVPTPELYHAIQRGLADIGCFMPPRYPNEFPITILSDCPFLFQSARAAAYSMAELLTNNQELQKEFSAVKVYGFSSSTPLDIVSTKPIRTLEDIKGKRFGVLESASVQVIELLGGVPILLNMSDLYISLQRGMVDAVVSPVPTYRSTKVCEVGKYIIKCNIKCNLVPMVINLNSYNSLPADVKTVFDKYSMQANTVLETNWVEIATEKDLQWIMENNKVEIIEIAPEEIARWNAAVKPIYDAWINLAKKNGVKNPEAILAELRGNAEKYNKVENQVAESAKYKEVLGDLYVNYKEQ